MIEDIIPDISENPASPPLESVSGTVDSVIFSNDENGYKVCVIEDQNGDPVTITGIIPFLSEGDRITAYGRWENNKNYGLQFKTEKYDKSFPEDAEDILRFLTMGNVKGIGPKTAQKIVEKFGNDSLLVIEKHPEWLCDIPGVTKKRAEEISENYRYLSGARYLMMFCRDYFTPQAVMKIYDRLGEDALEMIKKNPYVLCEEVSGIGFKKADQLAQSIGIAPDDPERIVHGIRFVLTYEAENAGHTCLPAEDLVALSSEILFGDDAHHEEIRSVLEKAVKDGRLVSERKGKGRYVFTPRMHEAEKYIADKMLSLSKRNVRFEESDIPLMIEKAELQSGRRYAPEQRKALSSAIKEGVLILTGGPGTGKTTVIQGLISIFTSFRLKVVLAAPTGRAAKRMSEATSYEARTIHRLLEMDYSDEDKKVSRFTRNEDNPVDADVVIIDESSMIDVLLMESLLRAMKKGARLILIGDVDQLPSVGPGNVLRDLMESGYFPVVTLKEIFRQSEDSLIITNAHLINDGEMPELSNRNTDFFFLRKNSDDDIADAVVGLVSSRLPKAFGEKIIDDIQIITPSKKGAPGTENLNYRLQAVLNPPSPDKKEKVAHNVLFREGDRIMQTRNNYTAEWTTPGGKRGLGIFNGDIGTIRSIAPETGTIEAYFDDRRCELDFTMFDDISHSYAVTVHKSQGSEYPIIIIPLYSCSPRLQTRNLIYTAVTRAQKMVILVGRQDILQNMIDNNVHSERCTMLKDFLKLKAIKRK